MIAINDNKLSDNLFSRNLEHKSNAAQDDIFSDSEGDDNSNKLMDNLAESIEYLSRISPTTTPEWMD